MWAASAALTLLAATAVSFVQARGWALWYGDAQAHLNIARRLVDTRVPAYEQLGTVWLPLPHLLMLPFVSHDAWWQSGLAGAIPSALAYIAASLFLFLAARRLLGSLAAACAALAAFALNPNLLYLASTPMTEPLALASVTALLYFLTRFTETRSTRDAALAGLAACCGTLTRYEAWFLLPAAALFLLYKGGLRKALVFSLIAAAGPLFWLAHNQYLFSDALEFYRGRWSAKAIYARQLASGLPPYPGDHNWLLAWRYYTTAARLCVGTPLLALGLFGLIAAFYRRAWWAVALLALSPGFYVLSLYSSGTPIYVPTLWPFSHYNTRYGLNLLPLVALGAGALVLMLPHRLRPALAVLVTALSISPWLLAPRPEAWICWAESKANSSARRAWTEAAAAYLQPRYKAGQGILMNFGDLTGILREAGIPLHESLHEGDIPLWDAAIAQPALQLHEEWGIAIEGDSVSRALRTLRRGPRRFECVRIFKAKDAPPIEIWRHIP